MWQLCFAVIVKHGIATLNGAWCVGQRGERPPPLSPPHTLPGLTRTGREGWGGGRSGAEPPVIIRVTDAQARLWAAGTAWDVSPVGGGEASACPSQ